MRKINFKWQINFPPPEIESHSIAKLNIIEDYLTRYFDTVVPDPRQDRLQISLIDGFCGGGAFRSTDGKKVLGTPIIMLKAVEAAEKRLNINRHKKLNIDARFYFIDKKKDTINYLKQEIEAAGFGSQIGQTIHIRHGKFEEQYNSITRDILTKARAGRSLFLLDQFGYSDVPLSVCRHILGTLPRSEIILTFATDWLIDYMSTNPSFIKAVTPIEITESEIVKFLETKDERHHRYLIQRSLANHIHLRTNAPYFTPFFIHDTKAHRDLWLLHLSQHSAARNVMVSSHWEVQNISIHQGKGGLNILGFAPNWEDALLNFLFDEKAKEQTITLLQSEIPQRLEFLSGYEGITMETFKHAVANDTVATFDQIQKAVMELYSGKDIEIWTPSGRKKSMNARLLDTDRIQLPHQIVFPALKTPK